ncbi:NAD(P)-dependent oxidoreductase [Aspergillus candidus]|uniref:6-phosphogluconate dehydrogenase-like protein n=1 Tax=Aspergillus candidus TaxID=41067 RepID=A0A2I2FGN2_ASPCN|nr:6-phosphogluconate dehydrogenase-like protein [Aspergillus candidus]PLB39795.1 6-phosphogluconate dehydrogenase-like protein [Aspergillus candidus]
MTARIAFIGIGQMGQGITTNLVQHGIFSRPLTIYNRTKSKAEDHAARIGNCRVVDTVEEAVASSDIIWSCLQDQGAVQSVFDNALVHNIRGKLFVDSSTIGPESTNEIARRVIAAGGEFVAMPVMGEPKMAHKQTLTCIPCGKAESVDRIRPFLQGVICRNIVDLSGEEPGTALLLKLMGNVIILATMETVAEVNVFAEKCGLGVRNMNKLMTALFPNPPHAAYNDRMLSGDYHRTTPMVEVQMALALAEKVKWLAHSCGASIKIYDIACDHLETVLEHEGPRGDAIGIYGAVRMESGLSYKNDPEPLD